MNQKTQENIVEEWFVKQQKELSIDVKEIPLAEAKDWKVVEENGVPNHIGHTSGKYHRGVFLKAIDRGRKGANGKDVWLERFMVAPIAPNDGIRIYGIVLMARYNGRYLIQAKSEPGNQNPGHVQITSTIQASRVNIEDQLSGAIPFADMYHDPRCVQFEVPQDGAQLYLKNNKVCFLELSEEPKNIPENFTWATLEEIFSFAERGLVSEHIMQSLGVSHAYPMYKK